MNTQAKALLAIALLVAAGIIVLGLYNFTDVFSSGPKSTGNIKSKSVSSDTIKQNTERKEKVKSKVKDMVSKFQVSKLGDSDSDPSFQSIQKTFKQLNTSNKAILSQKPSTEVEALSSTNQKPEDVSAMRTSVTTKTCVNHSTSEDYEVSSSSKASGNSKVISSSEASGNSKVSPNPKVLESKAAKVEEIEDETGKSNDSVVYDNFLDVVASVGTNKRELADFNNEMTIREVTWKPSNSINSNFFIKTLISIAKILNKLNNIDNEEISVLIADIKIFVNEYVDFVVEVGKTNQEPIVKYIESLDPHMKISENYILAINAFSIAAKTLTDDYLTEENVCMVGGLLSEVKELNQVVKIVLLTVVPGLLPIKSMNKLDIARVSAIRSAHKVFLSFLSLSPSNFKNFSEEEFLACKAIFSSQVFMDNLSQVYNKSEFGKVLASKNAGEFKKAILEMMEDYSQIPALSIMIAAFEEPYVRHVAVNIAPLLKGYFAYGKKAGIAFIDVLRNMNSKKDISSYLDLMKKSLDENENGKFDEFIRTNMHTDLVEKLVGDFTVVGSNMHDFQKFGKEILDAQMMGKDDPSLLIKQISYMHQLIGFSSYLIIESFYRVVSAQ